MDRQSLIDMQKTEVTAVPTGLPASMKELMESGVAFSTIEALCEACGGWELTVPKNPKANHILASKIGLAGAREISKVFGGRRVTVPFGRATRLVIRNELIVKEYGEGVSANELASRYRLSARQIWSVLGGKKR